MTGDSPFIFTIIGGAIGVVGSLAAILLQHHLEKTEKQKDRIRNRGKYIETLIDEYERRSSEYWSSPDVPDMELPKKINSLKSRIGKELGNLAKQKYVTCRESEIHLTLLHQAATRHDTFSTNDREVSAANVLQVQDAANQMRVILHLDLDML